MIQVGDIVRHSNQYLRSVGSLWHKRKGHRRGKQRLFRVVRLESKSYYWRVKKHNIIVSIENIQTEERMMISTTWLRFVRRPKKAMACRSQLTHANVAIPARQRRSALSAR